MFNGGIKGRRARDVEGITNPQAKFVQTKYPQPYISGYVISGIDDTALDIAGGQTIIVNGSGFATGVSATVGGVQIGAVSYISPTQISFTSPALSAGTYNLVVYNAAGGAAILVPGITYSSFPTFTTAVGSIGSVYETKSINTSVVATSDSSVTYSLVSGSLPPGSTLASNGTITGTAPVDSGSTTYTFSIKATDAELQDVTRTFTLTINTDTVTWVTPSSGATINLDNSLYSQALNATDAAGYSVTYTANALPTGLTLTSGVISGTPSSEGTTTTLLTATASTTNRSSTNTITWVVLLGDMYFRNVTSLLSADSTLNIQSFIADNSISNTQLVLTGDTKAQNFNPYQFGYYSIYSPATGSYLYGTNSILNISATTVVWTFECWCFPITSGTIFAIGNGGAYGNSFSFDWGRTNANKFTVGQGNGSSNPVGFTTTNTYTQGRWYHVAVTRTSAGVYTMWINGVADGTQTYNAGTVTAGTTFVVNGLADNNGTGNGGGSHYISNLRFLVGTALYSSTFTPPTGPLPYITNTVLLLGQTNRFMSYTPLQYSLTTVGTIQTLPAHPFATTYKANALTYSYQFNGSSDYVTIPHNTVLDLSTGDYTIEVWIYSNATPAANQMIIDKGGVSGNKNEEYSIALTSANKIMINIGANDAFINQGLTTTGGITVGAWNHIAWTKSGSTHTVYINGVSQGTLAQTITMVDNGMAVYIGYQNSAASNRYFNGLISNLRIVKGQSLYSTTFTPSTTPLTAVTNTSLLTCNDSTFKDNSANAFTVTTFSTPKTIPISPFAATFSSNPVTTWGSAYFDGTGDVIYAPSNGMYSPGSGPYTIEFWMYIPASASSGGNNGIVMAGSANSATNCLGFYCAGYSSLYFYNGSGTGITSAVTISKGQWYHIAGVRASTAANSTFLFINGALNATIQDSTTYTSPWPFYIGTSVYGYANSTEYFNGYITDVRFTKAAVYTSSFTPGWTSSLTTLPTTRLLTLQTRGSHNTSVVNDYSNFNNLITRYADTAVGTFSPYGDNWSVYFDGSSYLAVPTATAASLYGAIANSLITIEFWLYTTNIQAITAYSSGIFGQYPAAAQNGRYMIGTQGTSSTSTQTIYFAYTTSTSTSVTCSTTATISQNTWNHVAITIDSTTPASSIIKIYINGTGQTYSSQNLSTHTADPSNNFHIGAANSSDQSHSGYLSGFRFTRGQLVYTGNFTPSTIPPQITQLSGTNINAITNASYVKTLALQSNRFIDTSINNITFSTTGTPKIQKFSPFGNLTSTKYYSMNFDNTTGSYITATGKSSLALGSGDFTVECWVYKKATSGNVDAIYTGTRSPNAGGGLGWKFAGDSLAWNTSSSYGTGTMTVANKVWTHIAMTRQSGTLRWFIDGVLDYTTTLTDNFNNPTAAIGITDDPYYSNLIISDFRIVVGTAIYTSAFTRPTTPLAAIANTSLLISCLSSSPVDTSPNPATMTQYGTAMKQIQIGPFTPSVTTSVTYSPATYSGSLYYDGTGDYVQSTVVAPGTGDFTIEAWAYITSAIPGTSPSVVSIVGTTSSTGFQIYYNTSGWGIRSNVANFVTVANPPIPYTWYHVAMVRKSAVITLYVNGAINGTTSTVYTLSDTQFNSGWAPIGQNMTGYVTDVRYTPGVALYSTSFLPTASPLTPNITVGSTTYTSNILLNGTNNGVNDAGRYLNYESFADARVTTFSPYNGTYYSVYFNGSTDYPGFAVDNVTTPLNFAANQDFTVEFWVYPTTALSSYPLLNYGTYKEAYGSERVIWMTNTDASIFISAGSGTSATQYTCTYPGSATLPTHTWSHVALVRQSNNIKLYLNGTGGTAVAAAGAAQPLSNAYYLASAHGLWFGVNATNWTAFSPTLFTGYMTNFRYVVGTAVYTSTFTPSTTPLTAVAGTQVLTLQNNKFIDNSSNALTYSTIGTPKVSPQNPFQTNVGQSYYFDGTGDYLYSPSSMAASLGVGDFTIELWYYASSLPTTPACVIQNNTTWAANAWNINDRHSSAAGVFSFWFYNYSSSGSFLTTTTSVVNGRWYHLAVTRSGTTFKFFVNGVQEATGTSSATLDGGGLQPVYIGWGGASTYVNGYVTDVRITKGASRYNSTPFSLPTSPLKTK